MALSRIEERIRAEKAARQLETPPQGRRLPSRESIIVVTVTAIAGTLLLGAWSAQSYFQPEYQRQRQVFDQMQTFIEIVQARADHWQTEIANEQTRTPRRAEPLALALAKFNDQIVTLVAWDQVRLKLFKDTSAIEAKDLNFDLSKACLSLVEGTEIDAARRFLGPDYIRFKTDEKLKKEFADAYGDIEILATPDRPLTDERRWDVYFGLRMLFGMSGHIAEWREENMDDVNSKISDLRHDLDVNDEWWNRVYLECYLLGSVLIGTQFVLVKMLRWPEFLSWRETASKGISEDENP